MTQNGNESNFEFDAVFPSHLFPHLKPYWLVRLILA